MTFKRIFILPKSWYRYAGSDLMRCSARSQYIYQQSRERFERRLDAFVYDAEALATGSVGRIEGFRYIK